MGEQPFARTEVESDVQLSYAKGLVDVGANSGAIGLAWNPDNILLFTSYFPTKPSGTNIMKVQ